MRIDRLFTRFAGRISAVAGQPLAFVAALALILLWVVTGPIFGFSGSWQLVINTGTTIVTFLIVFLIRNSQNRDAAAMQSKLDELLRAINKARPGFIGIEHLADREIERLRTALERESGHQRGKAATADESVDRLLERY